MANRFRSTVHTGACRPASHDRRSCHHHRIFTDYSGCAGYHLKNGVQTLSLAGLKAALLFIDAQQKRVGSETAGLKRKRTAAQRAPGTGIKGIAVINPTPVPLSEEERDDLLDYAAWRVNGIRCSLDPLRRETQVSALTDDKALLIVNCEAGAYNTIDLARVVSRKNARLARRTFAAAV